MQVEEKPDVTYNDVGGCKEQIQKLREVVETPLLHPERFVNLGIDPPKGLYCLLKYIINSKNCFLNKKITENFMQIFFLLCNAVFLLTRFKNFFKF